jgi:hypothetical protein
LLRKERMKQTKSRRATVASSSKPGAKRNGTKTRKKVGPALHLAPNTATARKKAKPRSGMRMTAV